MTVKSLNDRVKHTYNGPRWFLDGVEEIILEMNKDGGSAILYSIDQDPDDFEGYLNVFAKDMGVMLSLESKIEDAIDEGSL